MRLWGFFFYLQDCHVILTQSYGTITSYGFPQSYYNDMECTWLIQRHQGQVIELHIAALDMQSSCRSVS